MNAIEACNLRKSFGPVAAVDDVSITVKEGEIFGFLGQNGAGKTTAIRMMTVTTPDTGSSTDRRYRSPAYPFEAKLKMGVIPENGTVYSDVTAEQNVLWTAKFYGMDKASGSAGARRSCPARPASPEKRSCPVLLQRYAAADHIACAIVHSPPVSSLTNPRTASMSTAAGWSSKRCAT